MQALSTPKQVAYGAGTISVRCRPVASRVGAGTDISVVIQSVSALTTSVLTALALALLVLVVLLALVCMRSAPMLTVVNTNVISTATDRRSSSIGMNPVNP